MAAESARRERRDGDRDGLALLGAAALVCYAIHATFHLANARPEEMLWMCHLGAAIVGIGLLAGEPRTNAVGTLFLCLGTPLWLMDVAAGGTFYPTSCFTHLGGLAIGLYGVRRLGMPRGTWLSTIAALGLLILVSRWVTPPAANVNVAFAVQRGWEDRFASHPVYLATVLVLAAGYFLLFEFGLRRVLAVGAPSREASA